MITEVLYDAHRHIVCRPCTPENLHLMAELIGLKRCWYHARPYPHYDIPKRWVADFGLELDERLLNLDIEKINYRQVSPREILRVCQSAPKGR